MYAKIFTLLLLAMPVLCVRADEPKFDAEARARAIAPYLDEQTVALAHLDVTRLNADALVAKFVEITRGHAEDYEPLKKQAARWIADFTKAGGKEIYAVFDLADFPSPPFVIVPLGDNSDAKTIAALLRNGPAANLEVVEKLDHATFAGSRNALARLRAVKPSPRPEVAKAFAAAGGTAAQFLVVPTADARRVAEELVPTLPKEVGGGPMTIVTNGLQWAVIGADPPPRAALRVVIQSKDATAARALNDLMGNIVRKIGATHEVREMLPEYDKLAALFSPAVSDDRITLAFDPGSPGLAELLGVATSRIMDQSDRISCANNLHRVAIALHEYHDAYAHFPAVANFSKDGRPLLSWRVNILPYLGQEKLYKEFHLDEPWDSEHNKGLIDRMPEVFRCPRMNRKLVGKTTYLAPVGEAMVFTGTNQGIPIKEITDGTSNTISIVDADDDHAVTWTQPDDLRIDLTHPSVGLFGHHFGGCNVAFADASVHFLPKQIDLKILSALFTRNGGEVISLPR
jgi:hypothetical protein